MSGGIKHRIAEVFFDFAYGIVYRRVDQASVLFRAQGSREDAVSSATPFRLLRPTLRYWYADPIITTINGQDYVFCEVYDRKKNKGLIGVSEFDTTGKIKRPTIIIEEEFHLSFPLIFTYRDDIYMLPESEENRELRLYRMGDSPYSFRYVKTLLADIKVVDTVVCECDENLLFIACEEKESNPKETRLRIFGTSDLLNVPLTEYKSEDIAYSYSLRNGGPILQDEVGNIRVIQESTKLEYGRNLILTRLKQLDKKGISEEFIRSICLSDLSVPWPKTYRKQGTHTYGCSNEHEVLDCSFNRFHVGNASYYRKNKKTEEGSTIS